MDIIFGKDYLMELYTTGRTSDRKHRYQPQIVSKYVRVIDLMMSLPDTLALMRINSLNYERLKGDKKGLSSVRVNNQYRIEFEEHTVDGHETATICSIVELSNHYR